MIAKGVCLRRSRNLWKNRIVEIFTDPLPASWLTIMPRDVTFQQLIDKLDVLVVDQVPSRDCPKRPRSVRGVVPGPQRLECR